MNLYKLWQINEIYSLSSSALMNTLLYRHFTVNLHDVQHKNYLEKFAASCWDLISVPAQQWLDGKADKDTLVSAIKQADKECGSCGCNLDPLYKRALELL